MLSAAGIVLLSVGFMNIPPDRDFLLTKNMDIFFSMIREINLFYVDDTMPDKLIENGINGVLEGLDPYTTYIPASEKDNFETMTTGRYGGIGALIRQVGDHTMIIEPYENFPAQKSGLHAGDIIIEIDGKSAKGLLVNEVSELLKGLPKSKLKITVQRDGTLIKKEITRSEIKIDNVAWYGVVSDDIGYIQFNGFTENSHQEVKEALIDLKNNRGVSSIILDVRNNPGGLLIEAVNVTNLFVDKGQEIVSTRGKVKQWDNTYKARNNPVDSDMPVVVLVGRTSASAAEIVAGAFQDLDRGIIMGQRTFGKGLIQTSRQLNYGAQLKITTAKYYTPSGRSIQSMNFSAKGNTVNIPDSLINEFQTRNGRKVYDGGGITPDIMITDESPGALVINLYTRNHIFNYATKYAAENPQIPTIASFEINDEVYTDFIKYLEKEHFSYKTQTEIKLAELIKISKQENYYSQTKNIIEELREEISRNKQEDFETHKNQIKSLLREEIASRYYYQKGRIEASLKDDPYLEQAINLLNNQDQYYSILRGSATYGDKN